jgi:hypothetical protein
VLHNRLLFLSGEQLGREMKNLVEVAFFGNEADNTVRGVGRLLLRTGNSGMSMDELFSKLRTKNKTVGGVHMAVDRLKNTMELLEAVTNYNEKVKVGEKTRIVTRVRIKKEYVKESKKLLLRNGEQ